MQNSPNKRVLPSIIKELCFEIKKKCDANYLLLTEMREKLLTAGKIVEK
jgi:hypothetical protein